MPENTNPWVVQAPKQTAQVPVGFYTAAFKGVEDYTLQSGETKWRFAWEVESGPHKGESASALTNPAINKNTLGGRLISGLLGKDIVVGENVKEAVDACRGKPYLVSVQPGPQGGKPGVQSCGQPPAM